MNTIKYLTRTFGTLKNTLTRRNEETGNKLIHPRFGITTDATTKKKMRNSLFFLMYSEENGTLFI